MLKEIKNQIYLNRTTYFIGLLLAAGISLVVVAAANIAAVYDEDLAMLPTLGSIIFLAIGIFYSLMVNLINVPVQGDIYLKFGAIRRKLFPAMFVANTGCVLVFILVSKLWAVVDYAASSISGIPVEKFIIPWYWLVLLALGINLIGMWVGALLMRFGKRAFLGCGRCIFLRYTVWKQNSKYIYK